MDIADLQARLVAEAADDHIAQLVGAVVRDEDKVLLLRRPVDDFMGGFFELPSGKVDPGEDLHTAVKTILTAVKRQS